MIRRRLLAILAGVFVFAIVIGSAALLSVDSSDLQAGIDIDLECDANGVTVSYQTSHSAAGFVVDSVIVGDVDAACIGATLSVDLHASDESSYATTSPVVISVAGAQGPLTVTGTGDVLAQDVYRVAVLITGPTA